MYFLGTNIVPAVLNIHIYDEKKYLSLPGTKIGYRSLLYFL